MTAERERPNLLFRLAAASAVVFVLTVLAMLAAVFGDPAAPPARFLDQYGGRLIIAEVVVTLLLGVAAMTVDRIQILNSLRQSSGEHPEDDRAAGPRA